MKKESLNNRKEAYYFSHDSNARNDEKILALRMEFGMEGYGVYWSIIEKMRENKDYCCSKDYKLIGYDLRVDPETIQEIVEDFNLFEFTECGTKFYSKSLLERMMKMHEKSDKAREAANKRWNKKEKNDSTLMRTHSEGKALNEKKVKEKKEKEISLSAFTENDFLEDWAKCRKTYKNADSNLKRLKPEDLANFKKFREDYTREEFRMALKGLFQQENIKYNTMITHPTHFLERVDTYVEAFLAKDSKLYGSKQKKDHYLTGVL
ncbi:DUF4373 domain-containing protein [Christiangramia sabulilitoris]|uniref:DUF4373 domain-containing protein n=1 Tax=Christiangramia sabulilitoris TaxID=2583991 RepID=A0A550I3H0_9FLAO|nr:DUF4373 domain-containing protein [Christiangramia sabulilitoris]TRO65491.1 DUF4373 domain-containing protein [Christiangramia sabulilitoris]